MPIDIALVELSHRRSRYRWNGVRVSFMCSSEGSLMFFRCQIKSVSWKSRLGASATWQGRGFISVQPRHLMPGALYEFRNERSAAAAEVVPDMHS